MKLVAVYEIMRAGDFPQSPEWGQCLDELKDAIRQVEWPVGTGQFLLDPSYDGSEPHLENGVKPIKEKFQESLQRNGWRLEERFPIVNEDGKQPGKIDAVKILRSGVVAAEWETGNISSSHRALNKLSMGIRTGKILGGALVLPSRDLYQYLTDRIGNISEIKPYFSNWQSLPCENGILVVMVVEHDGFRQGVGRIPKGTDGRALR